MFKFLETCSTWLKIVGDFQGPIRCHLTGRPGVVALTSQEAPRGVQGGGLAHRLFPYFLSHLDAAHKPIFSLVAFERFQIGLIWSKSMEIVGVQGPPPSACTPCVRRSWRCTRTDLHARSGMNFDQKVGKSSMCKAPPSLAQILDPLQRVL